MPCLTGIRSYRVNGLPQCLFHYLSPMQLTTFKTFPVLQTTRLLLRRLQPGDAADVFRYRSDPEVMRYIPRPLATCEADALATINMIEEAYGKEDGINWAMELKNGGGVAGVIGYVRRKPEHNRAEVGYALRRDLHRQGLTREALVEVLRYGFEDMHLHSVEAIIDADNTASGALLEKVGFRQEAFFKEDFLHEGEYRNSVHFGMLRSEGTALGICR